MKPEKNQPNQPTFIFFPFSEDESIHRVPLVTYYHILTIVFALAQTAVFNHSATLIPLLSHTAFFVSLFRARQLSRVINYALRFVSPIVPFFMHLSFFLSMFLFVFILFL